KVITYGATLTELWIPDKSGKTADVVLGFDKLDGYLTDEPFFGATVGRYANRIANGKFTLNGKEYGLFINNGPNSLHGGKVGFNRRVCKASRAPLAHGAPVRLTHLSPHGEERDPRRLTVNVMYDLVVEISANL